MPTGMRQIQVCHVTWTILQDSRNTIVVLQHLVNTIRLRFKRTCFIHDDLKRENNNITFHVLRFW
jgi:hypothetical protein